MEDAQNAGRVCVLSREEIERIAAGYSYKTGSIYKENVIPFAMAVAAATVSALERAGEEKS